MHHNQALCRDFERNALHAALVTRAESWRWGSLRSHDDADTPARPALDAWPIDRPGDWVDRVNAPLTPSGEEAMRRALRRGQPLGDPARQQNTAGRLGLRSTLQPLGRPRKDRKIGS